MCGGPTAKGHVEVFQSNGNVLCLDFGGGYMTV